VILPSQNLPVALWPGKSLPYGGKLALTTVRMWLLLPVSTIESPNAMSAGTLGPLGATTGAGVGRGSPNRGGARGASVGAGLPMPNCGGGRGAAAGAGFPNLGEGRGAGVGAYFPNRGGSGRIAAGVGGAPKRGGRIGGTAPAATTSPARKSSPAMKNCGREVRAMSGDRVRIGVLPDNGDLGVLCGFGLIYIYIEREREGDRHSLTN
jgi:hypothetical protein